MQREVGLEQVLFCFSINLVKLSDNSLIWTTKKGLKVPVAYLIYDLSDPLIRDNTHCLQGKQGVYGFINVKSDHLYIGSSTKLRKRLLEHLFSNKTSIVLQRGIKLRRQHLVLASLRAVFSP
jgi:hypothetical protein